MRKRIPLIIISILLVLIIPCFAFADAELETPIDEEMSENYAYATTANSNLTIGATGTAKPRAVITGLPGTTTKLSATMYLQKYVNGSWKTVRSWSSSTTLNHLSLSKSKAVSRGKYRTHTVFKAFHNTKEEKIIKNSGVVNY